MRLDKKLIRKTAIAMTMSIFSFGTAFVVSAEYPSYYPTPDYSSPIDEPIGDSSPEYESSPIELTTGDGNCYTKPLPDDLNKCPGTEGNKCTKKVGNLTLVGKCIQNYKKVGDKHVENGCGCDVEDPRTDSSPIEESSPESSPVYDSSPMEESSPESSPVYDSSPMYDYGY